MSDDHRRSARPATPLLPAPTPGAAAPAPTRVTVLGAFTLTVDAVPVALPVDARRLVAYLAVHPRPQHRGALAGDLWPGVPAAAAAQLLDTALAAVDVPGLLADTPAEHLSLAPHVQVDLADALGLVRTLPDTALTDTRAESTLTDTPAESALPDTALLGADILPAWTASWIAVERERFRQLRLHATEEHSRRLSHAGRHPAAVAEATRAVQAAPSRGSARRALIEAHLGSGNIASAIAVQDEYQDLLRSSVGAPVSDPLDGLIPLDLGWPVLRVRRHAPRGAGLPGVRRPTGAARRLVVGGIAR